VLSNVFSDLIGQTGTVLRADVDGVIMMRAYLSGTPECKFGLNDRLVLDGADRQRGDAVGQVLSEGPGSVELDDCHFHPCVRLEGFESSRTISFIPPDGEFELMKSVTHAFLYFLKN
jgi:AP-2 complex subunit mu-1